MSSEQKIEKLRSEVQASRLLDDHEKADWLNLLELMNDKQISELEEILQAPAKVPAPAPVLPTLSHISNMPTQIGGAGATARPMPSRPASPVAQTESPRPALRPVSQMTKQGMVARPKDDHRPAEMGPALGKQLQSAEFGSLEDLEALNLEKFRNIDPMSIPDALHPMVLHYGYFPVLQYLESSRLYESYLATGKKLLTNTPLEPRFNLTQAEFEAMTDVLQAMRLNKS